MTPAHRRTTIHGTRLHYRVAGKGRAGTPVVVLPAPGDSTGSIVELLDRLGASSLSFGLDLPGHGRSANPPVDRPDPAWWLTQWIRHVGLAHCHLVTAGDSLGVALQAGQREASIFASICSVAPPSLQRVGAVHQAMHMARSASTPRPSLTGASATAAWLRSRAAGGFVEAMRPRELDRQARRLMVRAHVIRGELDHRSSHADAAGLARLLRAQLVELPAAPRRCYSSHPTEVARALDAWWHQLEREEAS